MSPDTPLERISAKEREYVLQVLDGSFRGSFGSPMTKRLEELFARKFSSRFAISFVNGTATMHAALAAAGIGKGDEVIVPPLTMASTSFAVLHAGATPVWADVDPHTFVLDVESVRERLTPRTKAILPVAIYGLAPDMEGLMRLARERDLFVLEDAAQCFLGYANGKVVGSIGHAGSFSFQSSKHMTSGEGGMVTTDDEDLATRIRQFGSLGYAAVSAGAGKGKISKDVIQDPGYERHAMVGFNYRLPEIASAVALGQLERLEQLVAQRQSIAHMYHEAVKGCSWLVPQKTPSTHVNAYWTFAARLDPASGVGWHDFRRKYIEMGGDPYYAAWKLTYQEPAFRHLAPGGRTTGVCPDAEALQPHLLQLKTNYMDLGVAREKADALARTVEHFEKRRG